MAMFNIVCATTDILGLIFSMYVNGQQELHLLKPFSFSVLYMPPSKDLDLDSIYHILHVTPHVTHTAFFIMTNSVNTSIACIMDPGVNDHSLVYVIIKFKWQT